MTKVELFEAIRNDALKRGLSKRAIARNRGIHRRLVRQALASPIPPPRKTPVRQKTVLTEPMRQAIDAWLRADASAPRKQRHTGVRIIKRLRDEFGYEGADSTARQHIGKRRQELFLSSKAFVPLTHLPGDEAEVDWYQAEIDFPGGRQTCFLFQMRACYSGREFHMAFPRESQQAFLEAHVAAFKYFGGVFSTIRYDNLSSAVKRVLHGRRRLETGRFVLLRSHYLFDSEFCQPGKEGAHEKGGVEGACGRFRRQHLTPVPKAQDFSDLNKQLLAACAEDDQRCMARRSRSIEEDWAAEQAALRALPSEPFCVAEVATARVDEKGRVRQATNGYSVPIGLVGRRVEVRAHAAVIEVFSEGGLVARHERLQGRNQERLVLDHYLELLKHKPGALARSLPLRQAREAGAWPPEYDTLWAELKRRYGETKAARHLLEVLFLLRQHPAELVNTAVGLALEYGACDAQAVRQILRQLQRTEVVAPHLGELGELGRFERPARPLVDYDQLLPLLAMLASPLALLMGGLSS